MRKMLLTMLISALLLGSLGSAAAQTELGKPRAVKVYNIYQGRCISITWKKAAGAVDYQVRVNKRGSGRPDYRESIAKIRSKKQLARGWQNWRDLHMPSKWGEKRAGEKPHRQTNWCGLASDQTVMVRVRAIGINGEIGPESDAVRFRVRHDFN